MKTTVTVMTGLFISGYCLWSFFESKSWPELIFGAIACFGLAEMLDNRIEPTISQTFGLLFLSYPVFPIIVAGFQGRISPIPAAFLSAILAPLFLGSLRKIIR